MKRTEKKHNIYIIYMDLVTYRKEFKKEYDDKLRSYTFYF